MRIYKSLLISLTALFLWFGFFAIPVNAEQQTQDGLEVTLSTDQESYSQNDQITATLTVTNTNETAVSEVSLESIIPEGYVLAENSKSKKDIELLEPGQAVTLKVVYAVDAETGDRAGDDQSGTAPGSSSGSDAGAEKTSGSTKGAADTGDTNNNSLWIGLLGGAAAVFAAVLVIKKKAGIKILSVLLSMAMAGSLISASTEDVFAEENDPHRIELATSVSVDSKTLTLKGIVTYGEFSSVDTLRYKVEFDLVIPGVIDNVDDYAPVYVAENGYVTQPEDPTPKLGTFEGWYTSRDYTEVFDFSKPITADTVIYAYWEFDETDSDGDGLPDDVEEYIGTDPDNADTDEDGLPDYVEKTAGTDPLKPDTDGDGVSDYDTDSDGDTLTNGYECENGTDPSLEDTDRDGLSDGREVNEIGTDPNNMDTDGDGASDLWELYSGFDPLVYNDSFETTVESDAVSEANPVSASATVNAEGKAAESLQIEHATVSDNSLLSSFIAGYLGSAYDFTIDGSFNYAEITFTYDTSLGTIGDDFQPRIYYFNEEEGTFEELPNQIVTEGSVTAAVEHFSTYVLLNKVSVDEVWATEIKSSDTDQQMTGIDVVFVIDSSGSMTSNDSKGIRLSAAKEFVDQLGENDRAAVIDFDSYATLFQEFTSDHELLYAAIDRVNSSGGTSLSAGMSMAISQFTSESYIRTDAYKYIIFLTDGDGSYSTSYTASAAENNIVVYTIGLGSGVKESTLQAIADGTGGKYYFASTATELPDIYEEVSFETIDYTTDSNNDGISDYYTKLIYEGKLRLSNSSNQFKYINFNLDQSGIVSDDYDGDGLKNGEELVIVKKDNRVYLKMVSNPLLVHSDSDHIDDYDEIQMGTDPLKKNYDRGSVDFLTDHSNYYYEDVVSTYDDSFLLQLDSAFLAAISHVWNTEELYREILIDYMADYAPADSNDEIVATLADNVDRVLSEASKQFGVVEDVSNVVDIINSGIKVLNDIYGVPTYVLSVTIDDYVLFAQKVSVYIPDLDILVIQQKIIPVKYRYLIFEKSIKLKAIDEAKLDALSAAITIGAGVLDVIDTISKAMKAITSRAKFIANMDLLKELSENGSRKNAQNAGNSALNLVSEKFGDCMAEILDEVKDDTLELGLNVLLLVASKNPYVKAITLVFGLFTLITGIDDNLVAQYQMLAYDCMADASITLVRTSGTKRDGIYYARTDSYSRDLTNLAQIRIRGEIKYAEFYSTGTFRNDPDRETTKAWIKTNIMRIKDYASWLDLNLNDKIDSDLAS